MALTAAEQYLLELINRARLDPQAEAKRYGVDLNSGLRSGQIDGTSKQVLAHNAVLEDAAKAHSDWMLRTDTFSHTGVSGSSPGERIESAGYDFSGNWAWRENLAWTGSTGNVNMARAIEQHHEGLYRSAGHRANTFAEDIREIGVAQVSGKFTYQGNTFNASMLTEKFAKTGSDVFVTGVAYADRDGDRFYSIGEGRDNAWVSADGKSRDGGDAGGFAVAAKAKDDVSVAVGFGNKTMARLEVDTSDGNVKLDMVRMKSGDWMLNLSGSADMGGGSIRDARLLGREDLDLAGNRKANDLSGNVGDNVLSGEGGGDVLRGMAGADVLAGGGGADRLIGGKGRDDLAGGGGKDLLRGGSGADDLDGGRGDDVLRGQSGGDTLDGGAGDDVLHGEGGRDTFIFGRGSDRIADFQDNKDTIAIEARLLDDGATVDDLLALARVQGGDVVFDFGAHELRIEDMTDIAALANDLEII